MDTFLALLSMFSSYPVYTVCSLSCGAELDYHCQIEKSVCKLHCITQSFKVYEQKTRFRVCKILFQTHVNSSQGLVFKFQLGFFVPSFCFSSFCSSSFCSGAPVIIFKAKKIHIPSKLLRERITIFNRVLFSFLFFFRRT